MALPVTLEEAKRQLRVIGDSRDDEINDFILDAAGWVEEYTGHVLEQREITERFASFDRLRLSGWPIVEGTVSVSVSGAMFPDSRLNYLSRPASVLPGVNAAWPQMIDGQIVEVTYSAGYASPEDVPRNIRRSMLILITGYDFDREGGEHMAAAEATAKRLCRTFKSWTT